MSRTSRERLQNYFMKYMETSKTLSNMKIKRRVVEGLKFNRFDHRNYQNSNSITYVFII